MSSLGPDTGWVSQWLWTVFVKNQTVLSSGMGIRQDGGSVFAKPRGGYVPKNHHSLLRQARSPFVAPLGPPFSPYSFPTDSSNLLLT